jgi:hypothetical protein
MGTDDFITPYSRWTGTKSPGVEVTATAYLNLAHGDWLNALPRSVELLIVAIFGLVCGASLSLLRPARAVAIAASAAAFVFAVTFALTWQAHYWFPWLIMTAVQLPVGLAWSLLSHNWRLHWENRLLEAQLATRAAVPYPEVAASPILPRPAELYPSVLPARGPDGTVLDPYSAQPLVPDHTLIRVIGQGAYGEVYIARDVIGSYHAVKIVWRNRLPSEAPFEREFRGISNFTPISLSHAGFVHVLHVGRDEARGYFYYVMQIGDDENTGQAINPESYKPKNLAQELKRRGRFNSTECAKLVLELTGALQHLHDNGLIHRDIKPSNIIFVNGQAKLADIGLVTKIGGHGRDVTYLGTEGYIPPEGPGTAAGDVYSLGKVMYELCTGLHPRRCPELPSALLESHDDPGFLALNRIILHACEEDRSVRCQSAAALQEALKSFLSEKKPPRYLGWLSKKLSPGKIA